MRAPTARLVARPVLDLGARVATAGVVRGTVRGGGRTAIYLDIGGFAVAVLGSGASLMPNCIALKDSLQPALWPAAGAPVELHCDDRGRVGVRAGRWLVDGAEAVWDPRLRPCAAMRDGSAVRRRGAAILAACSLPDCADPAVLADGFRGRGIGAGLRDGLELLLRSVAERDPEAAAAAAGRLAGAGPGLTPEGDDLLTAAIAVVGSLARSAGWSPDARRSWLDAVDTRTLRAATTALSCTLIELARSGDVAEPVHGLFAADDPEQRWRSALDRLLAIGSSTGPAYAAAVGAAALLC